MEVAMASKKKKRSGSPRRVRVRSEWTQDCRDVVVRPGSAVGRSAERRWSPKRKAALRVAHRLDRIPVPILDRVSGVLDRVEGWIPARGKLQPARLERTDTAIRRLVLLFGMMDYQRICRVERAIVASFMEGRAPWLTGPPSRRDVIESPEAVCRAGESWSPRSRAALDLARRLDRWPAFTLDCVSRLLDRVNGWIPEDAAHRSMGLDQVASVVRRIVLLIGVLSYYDVRAIEDDVIASLVGVADPWLVDFGG